MEQCWKCIPTEHLRLKESKNKLGKAMEDTMREENKTCASMS